MKKPVYLDYGATTPVDPRVVDKMIPYLYERFGNPASNSHAYGWDATAAVDEARSEVAKMIGADPREIVWTSGATEADNLCLFFVNRFLSPRNFSGKPLKSLLNGFLAYFNILFDIGFR